jgi:threonine/homoserine/homoserine lactone efflux protein
MIDDILIFLVAVWTLKIGQVSQKYLKAIKLISALVLLFLGMAMLFKPELLFFAG